MTEGFVPLLVPESPVRKNMDWDAALLGKLLVGQELDLAEFEQAGDLVGVVVGLGHADHRRTSAGAVQVGVTRGLPTSP